ncbi:MAG: alkaline phosphatase family protein [Candidatus Cybelea sp.]
MASKIQHVVIIIQENRSFNNLFLGYRGATTSAYGDTSKGEKVKLKPVPLEAAWDLEHSASGFFLSCNGMGSIPGTDCQMNGFNNVWVGCGHSSGPPCPIPHPQYAYVPYKETAPYFAMAKQYVLADQMYASNIDGSFVSHQYIVAGQGEKSVDYPLSAWGCDGGSSDTVAMIGSNRQVPDGYEQACFADTSLGEEADDAGVTWAYYTGAIGHDGQIYSAYQANKYVYYGSDWKNDVITPQTQFLTDVSNGKLRQISWITPIYANSDHPNSGSNTGPMWVASLVNAIGQSQYWDSTAIFIFWDDFGGWYDPEPPGYVDYDGLGIRVPLIIISPYARNGHVSHVHYEHGSILKFVEDLFGLPRLAASDKRAKSPEKDAFDFKKPPRQFKVIPSVLGKDYFMHQPLDLRPPDND